MLSPTSCAIRYWATVWINISMLRLAASIILIISPSPSAEGHRHGGSLKWMKFRWLINWVVVAESSLVHWHGWPVSDSGPHPRMPLSIGKDTPPSLFLLNNAMPRSNILVPISPIRKTLGYLNYETSNWNLINMIIWGLHSPMMDCITQGAGSLPLRRPWGIQIYRYPWT